MVKYHDEIWKENNKISMSVTRPKHKYDQTREHVYRKKCALPAVTRSISEIFASARILCTWPSHSHHQPHIFFKGWYKSKLQQHHRKCKNPTSPGHHTFTIDKISFWNVWTKSTPEITSTDINPSSALF